jgi:hypothetical protein
MAGEDDLMTALAQLRHAYQQLIAGSVRNQQQFAKCLVGPQIEKLERLVSSDERYRAKGSRTIPLTTLKWWRDLVDLNPQDLAPRLDRVIEKGP